MRKKEDILTLNQFLSVHLAHCYKLCRYNKSELARRLDITLRTVRTYCHDFKLNDVQLEENNLPSKSHLVKPLEHTIKEYITKAYKQCNYCKSELARRLEINVRTVRTYCKKYNLDANKVKKVPKPKKVKLPEYPRHFYCMEPVTKEQRDDWYNRDYF